MYGSHLGSPLSVLFWKFCFWFYVLCQTLYCLLGCLTLCVWPSTLWAHNSTFSLMTLLVSFIVVNSLVIHTVMTSSFMQLINCSFILWSSSFYLHSAPLFLVCASTPQPCLCSLQHWRDNTVSLCQSLNLSASTCNSPFAVWQDTHSIFVSICMNWSPSLPSQFFIVVIFSASLISLLSQENDCYLHLKVLLFYVFP